MNTREYTVVYERAGDNYSAYVPDLPGIVAAADTVEETRALIQEAIELYFETLRSEGLPIPEPSSCSDRIAVAA